VFCVGGTQLRVAEPVPDVGAVVTPIENAGSDAVALPSLTRIWMLLNVPVAVGVPESRPLDVLNVAHDGLFEMLKVSGSLFASRAVGVKLYATLTCADVGGVPVMVGAEFEPDPETVMLNAGSIVDDTPSVTMIMINEYVPVAVGVPLSRPVLVLNVAHAGLLRMENVSVLPSGSLAVGWNEYAVPTVAVVTGVPEMVGDLFGFGCTTIENTGKETRVVPSVTEIVTPLQVFACSAKGVPESRPVLEENDAQPGLLAIENVSALPSASLAVGVKL
jgi:hypothetical protein